MLKHILRNRAPRICGKAKDLQKQIYDLQVISTEYLAYFYQCVIHPQQERHPLQVRFFHQPPC